MDSKNLMDFTAKNCLFIVTDTIFASNNLSRFWSNILEEIYRETMALDYKFRDKKLQYDINRVAAKISALSPGEYVIPR